MLNFVIAGRDTTAQALSWGFYMLCCHPRVERKLYEEIKEYIDDSVMHDSAALFERIKDMKYAHALYVQIMLMYYMRLIYDMIASMKCYAYIHQCH